MVRSLIFARPAATLAATALLALAGAPRTADACSCMSRSADQYFKQAQLVFMARAGKEQREGKRTRQALNVLHTLKGRPGKVFNLRRPGGSRSTCDRIFREGEVALVLVVKGAVSVCAGNYDLKAVQLEKMASYFELGRKIARTRPPRLKEIRTALAVALKGRLDNRSSVPVTYKPLADKRARIGKCTLHFGSNRLKHAAEIDAALHSGPLLFVKGRYNMESYDFRVLLRAVKGKGTKKGYETLARWGKVTRAASIPNLKP